MAMESGNPPLDSGSDSDPRGRWGARAGPDDAGSNRDRVSQRYAQHGRGNPAGRRPRHRSARRLPKFDIARLTIMALLFAAIAFFGGSARMDVNWLLFLRPICLFAIAALLVLPAPEKARSMRVPSLLLALLALVIAVQLVPLPPSVWMSLAGHERYAEAALAAGIEQPWRPISLAPWRTWNSLFALLPAAAMLIALGGVNRRHEPRLVEAALLFIGLSLLLSVIQVAGVLDGPPLSYRFFAPDSAIGFFANRNHAAAFLATGFPLLRLWSLGPARNDRSARRRGAIALMAALVLLVMTVVTGSRTGMVVGFLSLAATLAIWPLEEVGAQMRRDHMRLLRIGVILVPIVMVVLLVLFGKALAVDRLVDDDLLAERRVTFLPLLLDLTRSFMPFGSGFGSFDPVFRGHEPDWGLSLGYFNNAHNDLIELTMTGGLPALAVLIAFVTWIALRVVASYRGMRRDEAISVRCGAVMAGALLAASLTDYPLRTPLAGAVLVFATFFVSGRPGFLGKGTEAKV